MKCQAYIVGSHTLIYVNHIFVIVYDDSDFKSWSPSCYTDFLQKPKRYMVAVKICYIVNKKMFSTKTCLFGRHIDFNILIPRGHNMTYWVSNRNLKQTEPDYNPRSGPIEPNQDNPVWCTARDIFISRRTKY